MSGEPMPPPGAERDGEIAQLLGDPWSRFHDFADVRTAERLVEEMGRRGFWCQYHSPFEPGMPHRAGFTPHSTTGWNGRPDFAGEGATLAEAVSAAALLA
jgi:hypothetical protein